MKPSLTIRRAPFAGSLACFFLVFARIGTAQTVPTMTIEIYNSSDRYSIYPVLSTGGHFPIDTWMQAAFKVPKSQLADNPYPTPNTFRLYFNPTGAGIPPHGSISVTLPLYTQLVPSDQVNPTLPDQYVDWWNGGRISIYASLYSDGAPPKALIAGYTARPSQKLLTPVADATVPTCPACQRPPEIFEDTGGELPSNDPAQFTEYTLGAIDLTKDPYMLDVKNVDYDVSYVDNVYLPAAMEPYNNPVVGWIGTIQEIDPFKDALAKFLAAPAFQGWPQYVDDEKETILKIPSAMHIMLDQANLTPAPPWAPIEKMKTLWRDCAGGEAEPICSNIRDVRDLFTANYTNYKNNYGAAFHATCDQAKDPDPATLDDSAMLAHVYAWTPFNANCKADTNLLEDTPGYQENNYSKYQAVKSEFDDLNNWPTGEFNPYVKLIHDPQYLNAQYVYAYSVDDAVGNMQTTGEGLIIAVGGSAGLPNQNPATSPIHVPFGWAATDAVRFVKYGICTSTPDQDVNPNFTNFDLSANQLSDCTLSFLDNQANLYFFKITSQPPYPSRPPDGQPIPAVNKTMIDCSGNPQKINDTWCNNIFGYTQAVVGQHKREDDYISVPAPAQPPVSEPTDGSVYIGKLDVSANQITRGDTVILSATLSASGAAASEVSVNFYDGDPDKGGLLFAVEQIPYIAADAQHLVQTMYKTNTCGVHQLFAVANKGKPSEVVRRAHPVRVACNGSESRGGSGLHRSRQF
jgi:hypothetical protein